MSKTKKGKLIVFEGVDATGKTTLCNELHRILISESKPVKLFHFPGKQKGTLGELVNRIHHQHEREFGVSKIDPCSIQLLHIAAHVDAIESEIKPAIIGGGWILLDRFWWSTYVYGINNGVKEKQLRFMIEVEKESWENVTPDVIFLVDSEAPLRGDVANTTSWQNIRQLYNEIATRSAINERCVRLETRREDLSSEQAISTILTSIRALGE